MTLKRKRVKQEKPLQERLQISARHARLRAERLPPGEDRDMLLRRARESEVTSDLTGWLSLPNTFRR